MAGGGPGDGAKPPPPPKDKAMKVPKPPNPAAKDLTDAQKKWLLALHEKYGKPGISPLSYVVRPGEQTHNIDLK
jgi:hypothetical protein